MPRAKKPRVVEQRVLFNISRPRRGDAWNGSEEREWRKAFLPTETRTGQSVNIGGGYWVVDSRVEPE